MKGKLSRVREVSQGGWQRSNEVIVIQVHDRHMNTIEYIYPIPCRQWRAGEPIGMIYPVGAVGVVIQVDQSQGVLGASLRNGSMGGEKEEK